MSNIRTFSRRVGALALFGLFLGAALAEAQPPGKTKPGKSSSSSVRIFGSLACVTQGIACNATVSGELTADDCRLDLDNSFYDAWTFQGVAGQTVVITMRSTAVDSFLFLLDPNGFEIESNDDSGGGNDARMSVEIDTSGTYTIYANSFDAGETGAYTLQLVCTGGPSTCTTDGTTLCLNNGRFQVRAIFSAPNLGIINAPAQAVPMTSDTGYFWFFSANNVEIVLKAVDGRSFNNHFWVFYGALSNVEYTITVRDTQTGATKTYTNPAGNFGSVGDTNAF